MAIISPELTRHAWETGRIEYRFRETQKLIYDAWARSLELWHKFYIECHRRNGKSTLILLILTKICIKRPGARCGFYAPVKDGLKDYIVPIIADAFSDCPEDLKPRLDATLTLHFPNGSTILFRGSNNKQHRIRRGVSLHAAGIDEARDVDELDSLIDHVILPALFDTNGALIISSTPADTDDHELKAYREEAKRDGWYIGFDIEQAHALDPQTFSRARIDAFKREITRDGKDPIAWEREFMIRWVKDPTKIIVPEWDDKFVVDSKALRDEFFPFYQKYSALDTGVEDKTAGICGYYDFKNAKLIVESDFALQGEEVRTDRIADAFKLRESQLEYQLIHDRTDPDYARQEQHQRMKLRVADNNNLILVNDLNSIYKLDFIPTSKDELPAMINAVRELVKDGRILVDKSCTELLGCLRNAIWDRNKTKLAKSKVFGHFDAFMALVYLVRNLDFTTNPIPKYFGMSWATHPGVPADAHAPRTGAWALARALQVTTDHDRARSDFARGKF